MVMREMPRDVLTWLDEQVQDARDALVALVDRTDALVELRHVAVAASVLVNQTVLTVDELIASPTDETQRARLLALIDRATEPDPKEQS